MAVSDSFTEVLYGSAVLLEVLQDYPAAVFSLF